MKRAPGDTPVSPGSTIYTLFAISGGALCLLWPALANHYPILFSDSGWFLRQALLPMMLWDKPWIYGPVLAASSLTMSLWLPVFAQGMLVSWVLWRVQAIWQPPSPWHHLSLCLLLALGSAASWFTSLLMPDIMAPLTVLLLFLTVFTPARERSWAPVSAAIFAIAAHLAHVPLAAACLLAALALRPTRLVRAATPAPGRASTPTGTERRISRQRFQR